MKREKRKEGKEGKAKKQTNNYGRKIKNIKGRQQIKIKMKMQAINLRSSYQFESSAEKRSNSSQHQ